MMQNAYIRESETFPHSSLSLESDRESKRNVKVTTAHPEDLDRKRVIHNLGHLSYECMRRCTFDSWPVSYINKDELAKNGFFYLCQKDLVQCYFCKGVIGFWEQGDSPSIEHKKHYPGCPFVLGQPTSNIALNPSHKEDQNLFWFLNEYLQKSLERHPPAISGSGIETDSLCLGQKSLPAHPPYSSLDNRMYSFLNTFEMKWPSTEKLAQAGFFYTGVSDYVSCYQCGGGLFNWLETDDPLKDHRQYYSHCPFVNKDDEERGMIKCSRVPISEEQAELLLHYSFVKDLKKIGFTPTSIKEALKEYLKRNSYLPQTFSQCIMAVRDWQYQQNQLNGFQSKEEEISIYGNAHVNKRRSNQCQDTAHEGFPQLLADRRRKEMKRKKYPRTLSTDCCYHECDSCCPALYQCLKCQRIMMQNVYLSMPTSLRLFRYQV